MITVRDGLQSLGLVGNKNKKQTSPVCKHNPFTHLPEDPDYPVCSQGKSTRSQCRSKKYGKPDQLPEPKKFGDSITADHKILNEDDASRDADKYALIVLDLFTRRLQGYACRDKSTNESVKHLKS